LDASFNRITSSEIHNTIPVSLIKLDLSGNPLGLSIELLRNLSSLKKLKEIKFEKAEIGDDSFPPTLFFGTPFVALRLFDLSATQVDLDSVKEALKDMKQELTFDFSTEDPPAGVTRILVGKRIVKEPWELELERRERARVAATSSFADDWTSVVPEPRAASRSSNVSPTPIQPKAVEKPKPKAVIKEAWEIEAEQGLLTEGGRRRARAAAATAHAQPASGPSPPPATSSATVHSLSSPQYFTESTQTLRLPASSPPTKSYGHARAFSMTASSLSFPSSASSRTGDLSVPTPTLPLPTIVAQPFADTLRVLILANRRMDRSFALPSISDTVSGFLPCLEELDLEGCNLGDLVPISGANSGNTPLRSSEAMIPTLAKLFPSLETLNLSYNALSNSSLTPEALSCIILRSPHRKGLRHLRLRGNRISELDGFLGLAEAFKGNRDVADWKLEELDVRDNEIGKLPPELGLLPLDVFLVDGNT
jgi:Leucine-rich repeat (LRR) protein